MKRILLMSLLAISTALSAQKPVELELWPDGAPNSNGITTPEQKLENNRISNVSEPTLTIYPAAKPNGLAVVACPGGGYIRLAMNHEGHEWHIQKVGIMGASAGGHLASTAATHYTAGTRPDFQILFYPVISMDLSNCHKGSRDNLLGKSPSEELVRLYSNELQVTGDTPPAFIMHSSDDGAVPVSNSVSYYLALVKNKVPASLHTYPIGGHGWGFRDSFTYKRQWTGELEKWLREIL